MNSSASNSPDFVADIHSFTANQGYSADADNRGDVWVSLSGAESGAAARRAHDLLAVGEEIPLLGNFDQDGKKDVYVFVRSTKTDDGIGDVGVALSDGRGFG